MEKLTKYNSLPTKRDEKHVYNSPILVAKYYKSISFYLFFSILSTISNVFIFKDLSLTTSLSCNVFLYWFRSSSYPKANVHLS